MKTTYIRLITTALAAMLLMGATGCSVIMGIFGAEESIVNDSDIENNAARILVPTPATGTREETSEETTSSPNAEVTAQPTAPPSAAALFQAPPPQTRRSVTITGNSVNVRNGPGTDAAILRAVPAGTTFDFVDQNGSGDWYQICCVDGAQAWVYAELAKLGEETIAVPSNPSTIATTIPNGGVATVFATNPVIADIPTNAPVFSAEPVADGVRYEYSEQGFAVTLPSSWQPLELSGDGLQTGLSSFAAENPGAAALVQAQLQTLINARFTLFAADLTPALLTTGYATTGTLLKQPLPAGITLELYTQITAKQTQEKFGLTTPLSITPLSLPAGQSVRLDYNMSGGAAIANQPLAVTQYLIMQGQTVYAFTFTTTTSQADAYVASFAAIAGSFQLLTK